MASRTSSNAFGTFLDTLQQQRGGNESSGDMASALANMQGALSNVAATSALIRILAFLKDARQPTTAPEIIKSTKVDASTALRLIGDATGTGLIRQEDLPNGGKLFSITPAGVEMLSIPSA